MKHQNRLQPAAALLFDLMLAYAAYFIARVAFLLENWSLFADGLTWASLPEMMHGALLFDTSAILYTNALWALLVLLPLHWKERTACHRACRWLFVGVNALALAINLADSVYFRYTLRRTTTTVFQEFQNEHNLGSIVGTEFLRHWYLVLTVVVVAAALWKLYAVPRPLQKRSLAQYYIAHTATLLLFVPLAIAGMRGGFTTAVRPITISNATQYVRRPTDAALVLNTPFSLIRTIGKAVFVVPAYYGSEAALEAVYTPVHTGSTGPMKPKNIVVLIVESFGREYIGALNRDLEQGKYQGYTPCVDSLIAHSITFRHSYCNGRKSIDGMPSILSGIPMFVEPFFLTPSSMNDVTGLAGILAGKGYATAFFHGAQNGSMGFQAFARKTGFQHYYGRTEYEEARGTADFDGTWAIWDEPFLQYYAEQMTQMQQPFMTALFTASSHHPFVVPEQYRQQFTEEHLPIQKCIRYTDQTIGRFFATARRQPWFQNTIFVLTSDHTNQSDHAEYQTDLGGFCSPVIFYDPSGEMGSGIQDKIAQQTDIVPTILGHLGYDQPYLAFGKDLLATPADSTWAVNYLNGIYQYVKHGHVLQFDGQQTKAVFALEDSLMQHNLVGTTPFEAGMERELKAIIQQYMMRMTENRLVP